MDPGDAGVGSSALDWLAPGVLQSYHEVGTPADSGQVTPQAFTESLAKLASARGTNIVIGQATRVNYSEDEQRVVSVSYRPGHLPLERSEEAVETIEATDIVVAAGPWTPTLLPCVQLLTPRGHSLVVRPSRGLSPHVLFPDISAAPDSSLEDLISPDIYPRPFDRRYQSETVYSSGPDDYTVPLPAVADHQAIDEKSLQQIIIAISSVSQEIHDGGILHRAACFKPQIRRHEEGEEVGPIVGSVSSGVWVATGHDEWGIQNAPGTGLVMSEMMLEGAAKSADCESLDPKHFSLLGKS